MREKNHDVDAITSNRDTGGRKILEACQPSRWDFVVMAFALLLLADAGGMWVQLSGDDKHSPYLQDFRNMKKVE